MKMTEKHHYEGENLIFNLITDTDAENTGINFTNPGIDGTYPKIPGKETLYTVN